MRGYMMCRASSAWLLGGVRGVGEVLTVTYPRSIASITWSLAGSIETSRQFIVAGLPMAVWGTASATKPAVSV